MSLATATFVNNRFIAFLTRAQVEELLADIVADLQEEHERLIEPLRRFAEPR